MKKKLIEVALPLEAVNEEGSRRKRKAPAGYPTTLHKWWAQRPVAAARAVLFAQMVDDPSSHPDLFPTERLQEKERMRLFAIMEELVLWENTTNEEVLSKARSEIWQSWRAACAENAGHPQAKHLFDRHKLPAFHDPFAGSAALPLEAQRLGLDSFASDLNPVAVLIGKATIEIPGTFFGKPPVNPEAQRQSAQVGKIWHASQGLAEDVRHYGSWVREECERRIGYLFPKVPITPASARDQPGLKALVGLELTPVAWLWARTVKSPDPAFGGVDVPLASTFMLATNPGKEAHVEPVVDRDGYSFRVKAGRPKGARGAEDGTKLARGANFRCLMSGSPIEGEYIKAEAKAGRMGSRMMAVVAAKGSRGRVHLSPTVEQEEAAKQARPTWRPDVTISGSTQYLGVKPYGIERFDQLFTDRQLVALSTFSDLVQEVRERVERDAQDAHRGPDATRLAAGGVGAAAYADAICTYLAIANSRLADYGSSVATWRPKDNAMRSTLAKQAIQMAWDFAEGNPFGDSSSGFTECVEVVARAIETCLPGGSGHSVQMSVQDVVLGKRGTAVVSTDPPYYDNVPYADLSDFFYVWLRRSLRDVFPDLFATLTVPKAEELVAFAYRHEGRSGAEAFFLEGMTRAMRRLAEQSHPAFPLTIYYAFKQAESDSDTGTASTGWETFLEAVIRAGLAISGTWPMRTEGDNRQRGIGSNALASSIVLVCRPRAAGLPSATRGDFIAALRAELPLALVHLQRRNIAPVDLAQASIGPGMAVFTRYATVVDADGKPLGVREALRLINQVLDTTLAEQEGDFDADTRWALTWFEQSGFSDGDYGAAEQLSKSKNTSVQGMKDAGLLDRKSKGGKIRLLRPSELPEDWDPETDRRLTVWETVHHLIRTLEAGGEAAAAALVRKLGSKAEIARELAYLLYTSCERKKRAPEALSYNALVQSWPEITQLAREGEQRGAATQAGMFDED